MSKNRYANSYLFCLDADNINLPDSNRSMKPNMTSKACARTRARIHTLEQDIERAGGRNARTHNSMPELPLNVI